jgi:Hedgehog amino-terminal signalling domain
MAHLSVKLPLKRRGISFSPLMGYLLVLFCLSACQHAYAEPFPTLTPSPTARPRYPTLVVERSATPRATPPSGCALTDLWLDQHISTSGSYTQTETEAAGPMLCRIERNSCAFHYLVGDLGPGAIFKREEEPPFDEEDILMHPSMLMPLYRLSTLVIEEWGGESHLRVTDAYDSLLEHDLGQQDLGRKYSLHFEGRAIDLTLWPIEREKYSRLCALAHCAGFDWVHNEGDHCHAAIEAESLCLKCSN